jgi:hypothetical protein
MVFLCMQSHVLILLLRILHRALRHTHHLNKLLLIELVLTVYDPPPPYPPP